MSSDNNIETLDLKPGVNILEGPPNSGKTVWLNIIDFLLGDTDPIEEVLGNEDVSGKKLFEKYISASCNITINDKEYLLERKWHDQGVKHKIFINGDSVSDQDFSNYLLKELDIPILRFPKGNPSAERTWPSLSWRMMLRHIFRQERFWSDLADKQPEGEQHAVLTQFLGIADKLFSQSFGDVVQKRRELIKLEAEKEQFSSILDNIGKSMSGSNETMTFSTHESVYKAINSLEDRIKELLAKREQIINQELTKIETESETTETFILEKTEKRESLVDQIESVNKKQKGLIARVTEFRTLQNTIKQEIEKLVRTKEAGVLFSDLKITHCPACDQEVPDEFKHIVNSCFLCHQTLQASQSENRIDFEISQLQAESDELIELITSLEQDDNALDKHQEKLRHELTLIEREIAPLRNKMTALISPEIGGIDTERGRLEEQVESHKRILKNLDYKGELVKKIDALNTVISKLEAQVDTRESEINYGEVSSLLEDQMTNYLNELIKTNPDRWPHKRPSFRIWERGFSLKVNEGKWSNALGATSKLYFLFAYHYGLLGLSKTKQCNYPGLLIIDFPPELPNTENIVISESYVVEPFVDLCKSSEVPLQVIITGKTFKDIENVHKIEMSNIWK